MKKIKPHHPSKQLPRRVGAIMDADGKEVRLFGYGVYTGDEIPPPEIRFMGMSFVRAGIGLKNPKIVLDSGKTVWGCECWWTDEAKIKKEIGSRRVKMVDIEEERARTSCPFVESLQVHPLPPSAGSSET